jgi:hypothetical protein
LMFQTTTRIAHVFYEMARGSSEQTTPEGCRASRTPSLQRCLRC